MAQKYRHQIFVGMLCCSYLSCAGVVVAADGVGTSPRADKTAVTEKPAQQSSPSAEGTDSWYGKSVFERKRPEYENEGPRLGAFKLKPSIKVSEVFDSNIYARNSNTVDDIITGVKPLVKLQSDWSRHELSLNASGDLGYYKDNNNENYKDYSVGTAGRLDFLRETFLIGSASSSHLHEDRGSPDSPENAKEPTEYTQNNAEISFIRHLRRIGLKLDGDYAGYSYLNGETSSGTQIRNNDRNRDEYKATARFSYEIIPEYEAFIRTAMNERDYRSADDTSGIARDSSGYEVVLGTALNLGGKTKGEIFAGYMAQDYDAASLKDISGTQFGTNVLWNVTGLTSVKVGIARGVQETSLEGYSGYIATKYSLGLEHELMYNLLAGVNTSYSISDYKGASVVSREDKIGSAGAELRYLLNRNASVALGYNYSNQNSTLESQDYNRSLFTVGLKLEM